MHTQRGFFLIIAVLFILVIGLLGSLIAYMFANRAQTIVAQQLGLNTFYMAESGLEIGTRLLTRPALLGTTARLSCAGLTADTSTTNATLGDGTFTLSTVSSPVFAIDTLASAITSSSNSLSLVSSAGFASQGRVLIDKETINYAAISGNALIGLTRAANGTVASSHAAGAGVGQYQCTIDAKAGIPNLTSPRYQRELQTNIELQDGWYVANSSGSNFVLGRWNYGTELSWNALALAGGTSTVNLNGISMLSNVDGWAVGDRGGSNFIFLRWNGSAWSLSALAGSCSNQHLYGVSMVSSTQGWAVGARYRPGCAGSGNYRYTVLRWNGSVWSLVTPTTIPADASTNQDLNAVHVIDTNGDGAGNIGFAVGAAGRILQYNGTSWAQVTSPVTSALNGVFTVSASQAWAVGINGKILRWDGSSWTSVSSPTSSTLNAIAMLDTNGDGQADIGFAVGDSERIAIYNGSTWSLVDLGGDNLYGVSIVNAKDAWAVGAAGAAAHWNGTSWESVTSGTTRQLNAISLIPVQQEPYSGWKQIFR